MLSCISKKTRHKNYLFKIEDILSYAISAYSHYTEVMEALKINGFGIRCSDSIRNVV